MNKYKLYIFDWDGTLMDSVGRIVASMQAAALMSNVAKPSSENAKAIIGLSLATGIKQLFPEASVEQRENIFVNYRKQYLELNQTPAELFDNTIEMLTALKGQDKFVTIATGKAREGLERVLAATHTKHLFDTSKTADDANSKPHPDMIEQLLAEFNVKATDAVMIGDSAFDLQMAQSAGVDRIGVTMGAGSRQSLSAYQPKAIVDSIDELARLIL